MRPTISAVVLAVCCCLPNAAAAFAQVRPDSARDIIRVGTISVHAARPVTTAGGASALEVRLDSLAVGPAASMEQVLRELPLVQVRTNSRGEAQFSLRGSGSDARQVGTPSSSTVRPSTRLDFDLSRAVRLHSSGTLATAELRAAVDNVANAAIYDQCGLPQPGRTLRLQLRIR